MAPEDAPEISQLRLELCFRAKRRLELPPLVGSALRGLLGSGLEKLEEAAATEAVRGRIARLRMLLFEPRPSGDARLLARLERVPAPWALRRVFRPQPHVLREGEPLGAELVLVGVAAAGAEIVADAFALAPVCGFLGRRDALELVAVTDHPPEPPPPPPPDRLRIELGSPLALVRDDKPVFPGRFDARTFAARAVHRLALLAHHYCGIERPVEFRPLFAAAARLRLFDPELSWYKLRRWSGRQEKHVPVAGLLGSFRLDLADAPELWPHLHLASRLGIGKNTTIGCGEFAIASGPGAGKLAERDIPTDRP